MKTISELIADTSEKYGEACHVSYLHPTIYLVCINNEWGELDSEYRLPLFCRALEWGAEELAGALSHGLVQLLLLTQKEFDQDYQFAAQGDIGRHWLSWFTTTRENFVVPPLVQQLPADARALHFYGFKGGQARSSVLALLAKSLADDGAKVLIIDADVEAPSLDSLFNVAADDASSTLMGLCGWSDEISPLTRVYVGQREVGQVDMLACKPKLSKFDADFAGFLLSTTFNAEVLEHASVKIRKFANSVLDNRKRYDYVLFDHRTGLSPSVLPLMKGWPGSAILFARPDGMSKGLEHSSVFDALLSHNAENPGAFVTFSLDPKESRTSFLRQNGRFVERLLYSISDALTVRAGQGEDFAIDPTELEQYWVLWKHDAAMLTSSVPDVSQLSHDNVDALAEIRRVLDISLDSVAPENAPILTRSGATDEGAFILTPDFARIFSLDSRILYVFGRKGTGKTRLVRELSDRNLGTPLLVAQDFTRSGIQSPGGEFSQLIRACAGDLDLFWLLLLRCGIQAPNDISAEVKRITSLGSSDLKKYGTLLEIEESVGSWDESERRVFLIDGVETAVPASQMRFFVESLFRFLGSIQYSRVISKKITVRLFLRSDLQRGAAQNIEQQIEGSSLYLRWDKVSILNFAVARLSSLQWFRENFSAVCEVIDSKMPEIERGALGESDAEGLLLEIFPPGLERNKVKTTTFFATYFSDAGGDGEAKASFYPRLFDGFLREMNDRGSGASKQPIKNGRVESSFVLRAYDEASGAFIEEVKAELFNLLDLNSDESLNKDDVAKFVLAFSGLKTPFLLDQIVVLLAEKTGVESAKVRESLNRMKQLGIFEDRPGFPGEWRTGRLYKAGLQMKYVRQK